MRRTRLTCALALCSFALALAGCTSQDSKPTPIGNPGKPEQTKLSLESKDKDKKKEEDKKEDEDKKKDKP